MNVAVIPARGGSKRIPRKNIKFFLGKPIIAYSIAAARESNLFDRVLVSTDDIEITEVAEHYGAEVPFSRPAELAGDYTGTDEVFVHALEWLIDNDKTYDYACCVYPTAPLLKVNYLQKGLELLKENEGVSAFSVTTYPYPIFRSLRINVKNRLEIFFPEYFDSRSQDLPEAYHDAGQFYWVDVKKYLKEKKIFSINAIPIIIPRFLTQDIDTMEDWEFAEKMYQIIANA